MLQRFVNLYPLWLILTAVVAYVQPAALAWFTGGWISGALMVVMLGMGFTLKVADFERLLRMPGCATLGFGLQYTIMPLVAWGIARLLQLEAGFAVGLILLGSCPGGTASNVVAYLARANLALSVVLTMLSTMLAFVMTPLWCQVLAGQYVPVDAWALCLSLLQVVAAPLIIGVLCNWRFPRAVARVCWLGPLASVIALCLITGGIVSHSAQAMARNAGVLTLAVLLLHVTGFLLGYALTRLLRYSPNIARTVSIEVGMQNGGLAAMLAKTHFAAHPLTAVPAVFSAIMQNILGGLLAAWWRTHPSGEQSSAPAEEPDAVGVENAAPEAECSV
jgi:bile acid:Na+ symporter, BASS family